MVRHRSAEPLHASYDLGASIALVAGLWAVITLGIFFSWLDHSFDFTDESFYLLNMRAPSLNGASASLFGFALNPLYRAWDGSVAGIRLTGAAVLVAAAAASAWIFLKRSAAEAKDSWPVPVLASFVAVAAAAPLTYYAEWLLTPSYNWLALLASVALSAALALLLGQRALWLSAAVAGCAGVCAFLAKPTSAIAFAGFYLIGIVLVLRNWPSIVQQLLRGLVTTTVAVVFVLLFVVSLKEATQAIGGFYQVFGANLSAGSSLAPLVRFPTTIPGAVYFASLVMAIASISFYRPSLRVVSILAVVFFAVILFRFALTPTLTGARRMVGMSAVVGAFLAITVAGCTDPERRYTRHLQILLLVALMPWGYAIGTSNDLLGQTAGAAGLPLLAGLLAASCIRIGAGRYARIVPAVASVTIVAAVTVLLLFLGALHPYRALSPVWHQSERVSLSSQRDVVYVDIPTRDFIKGLRDLAASQGWTPGTALVDMTDTPGAAVVLAAKTPGVPWILNGYPFSESMLKFAVERMTPAEKQRAWVLHTDDPLSFTREFIRSLGINLDEDYRLVGRLTNPVNNREIRLYAPNV